MTTPHQRENRVVSTADAFARMFPGRDFAAALAAPYDPDPTPEETAAFNRRHAHNQHIRQTPARFAAAVADHPAVRDWAARWLADMHGAPWPLLLGATGSGKTHQAYGALRLIAESGCPVVNWRDVSASDLYPRLRPGSGTDPEAEFAALADAPLLLLDDLAAGRCSEFTVDQTYRLINHRYNAETATIITSNATPAELRDSFGDRTASRLRQTCIRVDLGLEDRRAPFGAGA